MEVVCVVAFRRGGVCADEFFFLPYLFYILFFLFLLLQLVLVSFVILLSTTTHLVGGPSFVCPFPCSPPLSSLSLSLSLFGIQHFTPEKTPVPKHNRERRPIVLSTLGQPESIERTASRIFVNISRFLKFNFLFVCVGHRFSFFVQKTRTTPPIIIRLEMFVVFVPVNDFFFCHVVVVSFHFSPLPILVEFTSVLSLPIK